MGVCHYRYKALIVDDERLARQELRNLLKVHQEVEVVGEATCTADALRCVERVSPDVVFLDIQMPGESGFDFIFRVSQQLHIIFVTAYDKHAVQAFDVDAVDYLLKPVHPDRLSRAVAKLVPRGVKNGQNPSQDIERVYLSDRTNIHLLTLDDIVFIRGANDYSEVVKIKGGSILDARTLANWEATLPANRFVRIHRSTIVNLDHVVHITRDTNGSYLVHLKQDILQPLKMSRRYAARVKHRFLKLL